MSILDLPVPSFMADHELTMFASSVSRFLEDKAGPEETRRWRQDGFVRPEAWRAAGAAGLLGLMVPEDHGGAGADFRYEAVLMEQLGRAHALNFAIPLHNAVVAPYIISYANEEQKRRWLPAICSGEQILAIAMTEPSMGSDLQGMKTQARRDGDCYILNGQKTFISNGAQASLIIVAVKTDSAATGKSMSLFVVETERTPGFARGRILEKLGQEGRDTTELFFNDMRVPAANRLGAEGDGFAMLMEKLPQERLVIAWQAMAMMEAALKTTVEYVRERHAFGRAVAEFQNTRFKLAECKTLATVAKTFLYDCTKRLLKGELDAATASMAKYWITEVQGKVIDECLQLFGGYGYMIEYPIAEMYKDARAFRIYGGTSEIMKLMIARTIF